MKIRIIKTEIKQEYEDWYDVEEVSIEYQPTNGKGGSWYIFLGFKEGSPNYIKFLPYGETAIGYEPKKDYIMIKEED